MKKLLLALFALFFLAGCGGGGDSSLGVSDMAGTFAFTKAVVAEGGTTVTVLPPKISGALALSAASRYALDIFIGSDRLVDSGAFSVSDPNITFVSTDGGATTGNISDNGHKITVSETEGGMTVIMEFTKI
jgi:hypothetical protein